MMIDYTEPSSGCGNDRSLDWGLLISSIIRLWGTLGGVKIEQNPHGLLDFAPDNHWMLPA